MSVLSNLVCIMVTVLTQKVATHVVVYHSGLEITARLVSDFRLFIFFLYFWFPLDSYSQTDSV